MIFLDDEEFEEVYEFYDVSILDVEVFSGWLVCIRLDMIVNMCVVYLFGIFLF